MPTDEDSRGVALGHLLRLQMAYELNTFDMANGRIFAGWAMNSNPMTCIQVQIYLLIFYGFLNNSDVIILAKDCWLLGEQSYMIGQYDYAANWLKESLQRYYTEEYKTASLE